MLRPINLQEKPREETERKWFSCRTPETRKLSFLRASAVIAAFILPFFVVIILRIGDYEKIPGYVLLLSYIAIGVLVLASLIVFIMAFTLAPNCTCLQRNTKVGTSA